MPEEIKEPTRKRPVPSAGGRYVQHPGGEPERQKVAQKVAAETTAADAAADDGEAVEAPAKSRGRRRR